MYTIRTIKDYSKYPDNKVLGLGKRVRFKMTGNINFPTPDPPLSVLDTSLDEYQIAITNAAHGGTHLIAIRKEKRAVVVNILQRLAIYVDLNGQNTESIMLEAGYSVYSTANVVAPASETPIILKGKDGSHSGDVKIRSKRMANALFNQIRFTSDPFGPDAEWIELPAQTKATFYITGLTPGVLYHFQTRTLCTKGQSEWSNPFPFRVR